MLLELDASQLVLVDYQSRLMTVMHDQAAVVSNAVRLARMAAALQVPVFVTEQNPAKLGDSVAELKGAMQEAKARVLVKMQFSAVEEGLGEWLRPPVKPVQGNARSLPKHLQKPAGGAKIRLFLRAAGACLSANRAGPAGGRVRRLGGDRCL